MEKDEIKVGEYVRTEKGCIEKFKQYTQSIFFKGNDIETENGIIFIQDDEVVKHSPNIIDLIEVGDIIKVKELDRVKEVIKDDFFNEDIFGYDERAIIDDSSHENCSEQIKNYKIESIVTKEQFAEMEYRV